MRKEATKVKFVIFHEELEVSSAVCSGMAGQKLLGANFWPDGNEIAGSNESESFSVHIVSFIAPHIQFLIRPVQKNYSTDKVSQ